MVAPRVTIGVPIHNEARFLDAALHSLLAQDYPNFEVLVSDNASDDETRAICLAHAARDPRLRYERLDANIGATANFRRVQERAEGHYFMWAAGHDLWSPGLLSECVALLENHPGAVLAHPACEWIDAQGRPLARESGGSDSRGMAASARLMTVLWGNMHPIYGVMRRGALRDCGPIRDMLGADLVLLAELALRGPFLLAGGSTWSRREFREERGYADKLKRYASASTGIVRGGKSRHAALLRLPATLLGVVWRARLSVPERLAASLALIAAFPLRWLVGRHPPSA